ncbi:MAG: helix-turn-helix domain-containing protein [Syntrophales bacterium]
MEIARPDIDALASLVAKEVGAYIMVSLCPGRWLTLKEAMAYAKVKSVTTIKAWIENGYIYAHKRSGQWIVDRESIDDWYSSEKVI